MNATLHNQLIELADAHQQADEYIAGQYEWSGGACAIGCTIRDARKLNILPKNTDSGDHAALSKMGVPEVAWRLCDNIFEGLPSEDRAAWTPRFLRAIKPDADYSNLGARIMYRCSSKLATDAINPDVRKNCAIVAELWRRRSEGDEPLQSDWDAARQQADAARQQADAAWQQADAVRQQAYAARQQADAAWQQADAARQQAYAARRQFWKWCGDMLCEELARV